MRCVIISGSRNPQGQTARATAAFAAGLSDVGVQTEQVFLPTKKIERCRQCDSAGWGTCRTQGRCTIQDDFAGVVDSAAKADLVAVATPVYFSDLSESLRAFCDRLRRISWTEAGRDRFKGKPAVGICVAGGGGGGSPACTVSLEKVLATCGFDVIDLIPVRRQNLELKEQLLRTTGQWIARQMGAKATV